MEFVDGKMRMALINLAVRSIIIHRAKEIQRRSRSEQNNVEGTISNSTSKPKEIDSPDIGKESINGLIASGNRTLNAGFDAVSKFFKKKA